MQREGRERLPCGREASLVSPRIRGVGTEGTGSLPSWFLGVGGILCLPLFKPHAYGQRQCHSDHAL